MRLLPVVVGLGIAAVIAAAQPAVSGSCSPSPGPGDAPYLEGSCVVVCDGPAAYVSAAGVQAGVVLYEAFPPVASCFTNVGDCSSYNFDTGIIGKTLTCAASGIVFLPAIETPVTTLGTYCGC
jgi:hypothetical protein